MKTILTSSEKVPLISRNVKQKFYTVSYYFIAVILLVSGVSKIINPENFIKVLNVTLGFLGENIVILIATILPVIEIALGLMLMLKIKVKEALIAVLYLFVAFTVFAIYGTIKGFNIDCGCFGSNVRNEFGVGMIVRNLVLLVVVLVLYEKEKWS
ncbi:Methylamine utilization protein [Ignavibacterium album JCM 16511]|uniref:Methylamine utilization protein n=1 Tax=Ignavibacterium album (strain DSM 19864 / JCM 16511 / NBRC 101810 / Mat9-16) TaxID=945713 RepID=I0AHC7_IGNAJ|nr:MauE/DoxX family redox-associated membrane protein [Ignavibacterium album]AFH48384.1 Methylamine utilization protein [Ignavibacterium album JCM 16511]